MSDNYYTKARDVLTDAFDVKIKELESLDLVDEDMEMLVGMLTDLKTSADSSFVSYYTTAKNIVDKIGHSLQPI